MSVGIRPRIAKALRDMDRRDATVPGQIAVPIIGAGPPDVYLGQAVVSAPIVEQHRMTVRRYRSYLLGCLPYLADPLPEEREAMEYITTFLRAPD